MSRWIFVKQAGAPEFEFVDSAGSSVQAYTSGTRSYAITHACDSAATYLVLTGTSSSGTSYNRLTGCTINSVSATLAAQFGSATSKVTNLDRSSTAMYYATGITGASLNIDTTWTGGNVFRSTVQVYKIAKASISVHDTATDSGVDSDTTGSVTLDVPESGLVFALSCGVTDTTTPSFGSTLTLDDTTTTNQYIINACGSKVGGGNGYTITGTSLSDGVAASTFRLLAVSIV